MTTKSWAHSARATTVFIGFALPAALAMARALPQIDALGQRPPVSKASQGPSLKAALAASVADITSGAGQAMHTESRLGVPTFLWGEHAAKALELSARSPSAKSKLDPGAAARAHLAELGALYSLSASDAANLKVHNVQTLGNGATIVRMRNSINGVEVFREEANVLMDRKRNLLSLSGYVMGRGANDGATAARAAGGQRSPQMAIASALADYGFGPAVSSQLQRTASRDGYDFYDLPAGARSADGASLADAVRVKKVLFRLPEGLMPAYYVEVQTKDSNNPGPIDAYSYVIAETDGTMLFRNNLTADLAFSYRVYAEASGLPLPSPVGRSTFPYPSQTLSSVEYSVEAPSNLITLQNWPFSKNDPWLPTGATKTSGNNVVAYSDLLPNDGLGRPDAFECDLSVTTPATDYRACTTGTNSFDFPFDSNKEALSSKTQVSASITNLFYMNNFLHDWYYDAGFDEASGNAQINNFGRGGLGNDPILAEAMDYSGVDNANMATFADGIPPRMQMFLWNRYQAYVEITAPAAAAGRYAVASAAFGAPEIKVTGSVVPMQPAIGCGETVAPLTNAAALKGNIAYVDRGGCPFVEKARTAQAAGATGIIIGNNQGGDAVFAPGGADPSITIGAVMVSQNDAARLKANKDGLTGSVVSGRGIARDSGLDNGVVAHEWGHYISNRLVGNANGLSTVQSSGMGEGWADFHALLLLVKESDAALPHGKDYAGAYATAGYLSVGSAGEYAGIRRLPYSSDMRKNPLTLKHISDGVTLPDGSPGTINSEVHNTGEVWASALWQCYTNLLRDNTRLSFDQAQDRMKRYLVAGYKMTPMAPTFIEARDAILSVIRSQDTKDFNLCAQGFATRGMGAGAEVSDRYSPTNQGVKESFATAGVVFVSAQLSDGPLNCDADGVLDNGETAALKVTLRNTGITNLSSTKATVGTTNSAVSFPGGTTIQFPATAPGQVVSAVIPVSLKGSTAREAAEFTVTMSDTGMSYTATGTDSFAVNADQVPNRSATDDVESTHTVWTAGSSIGGKEAPLASRVMVEATNSRWFIPGFNSNGTSWLASPPLNVDQSGRFSFTFKHRFGFEASANCGTSTACDGGVIDISTDGGKTWNKIPSSAISNGYNGTIATAAEDDNPRAGEDAFIITNRHWPEMEPVTVDLGTQYNGQTVQIRFLAAGDTNGAAVGWEIDDISFQHISNTPFDMLVPRANACVDKAVLMGKRANYTVTRTGAGTVVTDIAGGVGTQTISAETKRITFADSVVAMDTDGVPGRICETYRAALNRLPTPAELGVALNWMEKGGKSADDVLASLVAGTEFMAMSNAMSNTQFVANLYSKVMGKPTDRMAAFYANGLRTGYYSRAELVKMAAGSEENVAAVKAMIPNGVEYTPVP